MYAGRHRAEEQPKSTSTHKMASRFAVPFATAMAVALGLGTAAHAEPVSTPTLPVVKSAPTWKSMEIPVKPDVASLVKTTVKLVPPAPPTPPPPPCNWIGAPHYWNDTQWANARTIYNVGVGRGIGRDGEIIALMTAMQESQLYNLGNLGANNDHDSLGLFQQRPSAGWGTPSQVTDPVYASNKFYDGLMRVANWQGLEKTWAAQDVQISAFPYAYAKWETDATDMVTSFINCP